MSEILVVILFTLLGIITQRIIGFGAALFLAPVLLIYFSAPIAVAVTLFAGTVSSVVFLAMDRHHLEISKSVVLKIVGTALPGLLIGSYIVTHVNKGVLQVLVGILIILSVVVQEYVLPKPTRSLSDSRGIAFTGFLAGILNAAVAMAPMPILLWMRARITTPNQIRHNLAAIFILMNNFSVITIYFLNPSSFTSKGFYLCLIILPVILIGNIVGKQIADKVNVKLYHKVVFVAIVAAGLSSIVLGLLRLR